MTGSPASYNTLVYLHGDHIGSIGAVTNSSGALLDMTRFYPFGGFRGSDPAFLTERAFTGHKANNTSSNDLGLIFMGARYYVPSIGRFASPDTIIPNPADPQSYNRYSYALNSPTGLRDASGHCIFAVADTIACLVIAAKIVDYAWTGWDTYQAGRTLADANASRGEKVVAALNVGMAVFFEVVEPDDLLPVGVPLDDVARRAFMHGAEEALEEGGEAGLRAYVKNQIGDEAAEAVFSKMDEVIGITPPTWRGGLRNQMGTPPAGMVNAQAHHNLPWKFREWFAQPGRGLNVNDPAFGRWVQGTPPGQHQNWTRQYEQAWEAWISRNPDATRQEVLDFLQSLLDSGQYP